MSRYRPHGYVEPTRVCSWCPHALSWHKHGCCGYPGCGCKRARVKRDSELTPGQLKVLTILREAEQPLPTVTVRRLAGDKAAARGFRQRSATATNLYGLAEAGRARRLGGKWKAIEVEAG